MFHLMKDKYRLLLVKVTLLIPTGTLALYVLLLGIINDNEGFTMVAGCFGAALGFFLLILTMGHICAMKGSFNEEVEDV